MRSTSGRLARLAAPVCFSALVMSGAAFADDAYDLLFRDGTLDHVDPRSSLVYRRDVTNALSPEAADRDTGTVALTLPDRGGDLANLEFRQNGRHRALGQFPVSVGNPMIMYFYETVVRDMAEAAGGSPFYIRNRVKDALSQPVDAVIGETTFEGETIETRTVTLHPFADDPNVDRMQGFGDLALRVTMSDDVPGWYLSLIAETGKIDAIYSSAVSFEGLEDAE